MKLFLLLVLLVPISVLSQTKEYVCPPCNHSCDEVVYSKPGTCPDCHMTLVAKSSLRYENLTVDEFCERISSNPNAVLLDVRSKGEFDGSAWRSTYGHFKNAININVEELEERMGELDKYKDREILVYCSHSIRSPRASAMLIENGFERVVNMSGGVSTIDPKSDECLRKYFVVH